MLPDQTRLDEGACASILTRDDSPALSCLLAASHVLGSEDEPGSNPLMDDEDDGQPLDPGAMAVLLEESIDGLDTDNVQKIQGLLHAVSGDEFWEDPDHFLRMLGAILYGDPYYYEDEGIDYPDSVEILWGLYQVDALIEESARDLIEENLADWLNEAIEETPPDKENLEEEGIPVEKYYDMFLKQNKSELLHDFEEMGVPPNWVVEMDPSMEEEI